jgi:hypothetical protein
LQVPDQPGVQRKTLSKNKLKNKEEKQKRKRTVLQMLSDAELYPLVLSGT